MTGLPKYQLKRLQSVQNSAARVVTKSNKLDHITPVLNDLHWLPIHKKIDYKLLSITQKCVIGACPQYLSDLLNTYKPARNLRSSNQTLLCIPSVKDISTKRYGERCFRYKSPVLFNELPDELRCIDNAISFKKKLKTHLFKN